MEDEKSTHEIPVLRETAWKLVTPQLIILFTVVGISTVLLWASLGVLSLSVGAFIYLVYSIGSRRILLRYHNQGMGHIHHGDLTGAIPFFEMSYAFLSKYAWIDRFRQFTMLIPAKQSYREMALNNIAVCYFHLKNMDQAKAYSRRVLDEFPNNTLAMERLELIATMEQDSSTDDHSA